MPSNCASLIEDKVGDIVHSILNGTPFKLRSDDEKLMILQKGRPLLTLTVIKQTASRNSNAMLHSSWYSIYKWLCGSRRYNKFFCWPCLLMRPETSSWCSIGNDDVKRFTSMATKHARCKSHLKAIYEFDETLINLNLTPEYISESKLTCKERTTSDKTNNFEDDDDSVNLFMNNKRGKINSWNNTVKTTFTEPIQGHSPSKSAKITFKTWQELYRAKFPDSKIRFLKDFQMYKWKSKIAKQEFRNARLVGEKLKYEIEVLKVKLEYYKALRGCKLG